MSEKASYQRFETPGVRARERFDYWRTWFSEAVDSPMRLDPVGRLPTDFSSSAEVLLAGDVSIIETHCGPALGEWRRPAVEDDDQLRVDLFVRSPGALGQWHGHDGPTPDGTPYLFSRTTGAGRWVAPRGLVTIQVNVPRTALALSEQTLDRIVARQPLEAAPVYLHLIHPLLLGMTGQLETLAGCPAEEFRAVWVSLVTMLMHSLDDTPTDGSDHAAALRFRAWQYVDRHLADPDLDPASVAAALYVSRRTLYQAMSDNGEGIAAGIRHRRLQQARELLLRPELRGFSIAQLGAAAGLPRPAHFSRLYRAEFGESPQATRAGLTIRAADGSAPPPT